MKKKRSNSTKLDKIEKTTKQLAKENINISQKIKNISVWILILTAALFVLGFYQLIYQKRSIKEISRKPKLYLKKRNFEIVDSINKAAIFRCDLVNSGNEVAKDIKIRHPLYLDADPTISLYVSSQEKDEPTFFTPTDKAVDSIRFNAEENGIFTKNDNTVDSTISIYVPSANDTVYFKKTDGRSVSMELYYFSGISFQENSDEEEKVELHYIWLLWNMSPEIDTYYIPYFISSDKGTFEDSIKTENPFYIKRQQKQK